MLVFGGVTERNISAQNPATDFFLKPNFRKQELVGHVKNPAQKNSQKQNSLGGNLFHQNRYPPEN